MASESEKRGLRAVASMRGQSTREVAFAGVENLAALLLHALRDKQVLAAIRSLAQDEDAVRLVKRRRSAHSFVSH